MIDSNKSALLVPLQAPTDEISLIRAAHQNPERFGEIYQLYVEKVFRYLYSRVGSVEEAEDVTAQTFLAAFEAFDHFREEGHFSSWLFRIARNKSIDHFRKARRAPIHQDMDELQDGVDPLATRRLSEQTELLAKLIQALPDKEKELLRLRFLGEMSYSEIAHLLHRSVQAVKKNTYRLLARLHQQLEASND